MNLNAIDTTKIYKHDGSIRTYSGLRLNPFYPRDEDILIEDIAHGLANTCRFGGQILSFYSVAEHSVLVSMLCDEEHAMQALMHDAAEAYIGDIPTPIKERISGFDVIEESLLSIIFRKFNIDYPLSQNVHWADKKAFEIELKYFEGKTNILSLKSPEDAKKMFLDRFQELRNTINFY